jgi:hypothetical protein
MGMLVKARKALEAHVKQSNDPNTSQLQRDVGHMLGEMQASPDYPVSNTWCPLWLVSACHLHAANTVSE